MFHVFKQLNVRNLAYVIDNKGNKLFYGTVYQCGKFIEYMNGDSNDESTSHKMGSITERKKRG